MEIVKTFRIDFCRSFSKDDSIDFDLNSIILALDKEERIQVVLNNQQTIEEIDLLIVQIKKSLLNNTNKQYEYTKENILWGEFLENRGFSVNKVTYYLYNL